MDEIKRRHGQNKTDADNLEKEMEKLRVEGERIESEVERLRSQTAQYEAEYDRITSLTIGAEEERKLLQDKLAKTKSELEAFDKNAEEEDREHEELMRKWREK